ncbi:MAG: hypothetical protein HY473_02350 [Candidatus Sungbacteria bacterium]|uniref:Uncharacterized protein n=1 Tax=Candidatus Sungiibacteriota bacterium TaxID=2750080 RepID=A0A932YWS8_9BACT|nr:hypothetical protein [Candidatus Sungbacteria bacterium]
MCALGGGAGGVEKIVVGVNLLTKTPALWDDVMRALRTILRASDTTFDGRDLVAALKRKGLELNEEHKGQPVLMDELTQIFREMNLSLALIQGLTTWQLQIISIPPRK